MVHMVRGVNFSGQVSYKVFISRKDENLENEGMNAGQKKHHMHIWKAVLFFE